MKHILAIAVLCCIAYCSSAQQQYYKPKKIKHKGAYALKQAGVVFPESIEKYKKLDVYAFNAEKTNVGVTYEVKNNYEKTTFTIYVYPADSRAEGRLRGEYLQALQSAANASYRGVGAIQYPVSFKEDGYKVNGFTADINSKFAKDRSRLTVFECGNWFLKVRLSSEDLDSLAFHTLEQQLIARFSPAKLVQQTPLSGTFNMHLAPAAYRDSTMLHATLGSAYKKVEWAVENLDSLERSSCIPDMYLEFHTVPLQELVKLWEETAFASSPTTDSYISELKTVIESGFLEEMIMDQYNMVMIVPDELVLDLAEYKVWLNQHPVSINLHEKFYVLSSSDK